MLFERSDIPLQVLPCDERAIHQLVANIADQAARERTPLVAERKDVDNGVDLDIDDACIAE